MAHIPSDPSPPPPRPETLTSETGGKRPFHLLRYFSFTSLLIIIATAVLVQLSFRRAVVDTLTNLGETTNITLAQTALLAIQPEIYDFMRTLADADAETASTKPMPTELEGSVRHLIDETAIVRVKLYNRRGVVIFSTSDEQVGGDQEDNAGFQSALGGKVASELVYRDSFNHFDKESSEDNLVQSYLPVKAENHGPILGVFEIYTDVNYQVKRTERSQLVMLPVLSGLFLLMFVLLVAIVRRAATIINRQEGIIRERTRMLEFLTAQMLTDQEDEKKRIAHRLHESVAQTLSGVKMRLEVIGRDAGNPGASSESINSLIGFLQDAISETSSMAMRLRPSSLDEFGLVETLDWLVSDLRQLYPRLSIESEIGAQEVEIPRPMKIIIYRIVQDTLNNLAAQTEADRIRLSLNTDNRSIILAIEENSHPYAGETPQTGERVCKEVLPMRERTLLSGGGFSSSRGRLGRTHTSHWHF